MNIGTYHKFCLYSLMINHDYKIFINSFNFQIISYDDTLFQQIKYNRFIKLKIVKMLYINL